MADAAAPEPQAPDATPPQTRELLAAVLCAALHDKDTSGDPQVRDADTWLYAADALLTSGLVPEARTRAEFRINGADGPSYAIEPSHPNAEQWSHRAARLSTGRYVERRTHTSYPDRVSDWAPVAAPADD